MINLNHSEYIFLSQFECGKTQNIEIKIRRKLYFLDIDKNVDSAFIELYDRKGANRQSFSKYNANLHYARVNPTAILDRGFFENIAKIQAAQTIYAQYKDILNY
jgi:hypothetical protein